MNSNGTNGRSTLLVIDDEHPFSKDLTGELGAGRFDVRRACNAQEALDLLDQFQPDAILVDMILPDVSGLALLRRLRSSIEHRQLPIVVTSGLAMEGDEKEAISAGASGFLTKPFTLSDVEEAISPGLSKSH